MDRLDELKGKYSSVLRLIEQSGVRLQNVHVENNKLLIRGTAPSQTVKNQIWDQIKLIDPNYSDLTADISVEQGAAAAASAQSASSTVSSGSAQATYTVQSGDTLSKISKQFYGDANKYMQIFEANKDQLKDPNKITPGQTLKIPSA